MGYLGWTEAETLDTSMPAILLAYEGRVELLRKIFGGDAEPPPEEKPLDRETAGKILLARIRSAAAG